MSLRPNSVTVPSLAPTCISQSRISPIARPRARRSAHYDSFASDHREMTLTSAMKRTSGSGDQ